MLIVQPLTSPSPLPACNPTQSAGQILPFRAQAGAHTQAQNTGTHAVSRSLSHTPPNYSSQARERSLRNKSTKAILWKEEREGRENTALLSLSNSPFSTLPFFFAFHLSVYVLQRTGAESLPQTEMGSVGSRLTQQWSVVTLSNGGNVLRQETSALASANISHSGF